MNTFCVVVKQVWERISLFPQKSTPVYILYANKAFYITIKIVWGLHNKNINLIDNTVLFYLFWIVNLRKVILYWVWKVIFSTTIKIKIMFTWHGLCFKNILIVFNIKYSFYLFNIKTMLSINKLIYNIQILYMLWKILPLSY